LAPACFCGTVDSRNCSFEIKWVRISGYSQHDAIAKSTTPGVQNTEGTSSSTSERGVVFAKTTTLDWVMNIAEKLQSNRASLSLNSAMDAP
jgi:hypothetical protein